MPIVCEHCCKQIDKYEAVAISKKWAEAYLEDYFNFSISDMRTIGRIPEKEKRIFLIAVYVFKKFCKIPLDDIKRIYGLGKISLRDSIREINQKDPDFIFITKDLSGMLPKNNLED